MPRRPEVALYCIFEISKVLCRPGSLEEILVTTLRVLKSFVDMDNGLISLFSEAGEVEMVLSGSSSSSDARRYFAALPQQAISQLVDTENPLVVANVGLDSTFAWDTSHLGTGGTSYCFMGVPIKDNQRVIGTLTVDRAWLKFDEEQSDDDLCILKMVADLIGQNVQRRRKIEGDRARLFEAQSRR